MRWDLLPPQTPADCPHRGLVERDAAGEWAPCRLVQEALPDADPKLWLASADACAACCRADPPTSAVWNPVVASLVYAAAGDATAAIRDRAAAGLSPGESTPEMRAAPAVAPLPALLPAPATPSGARFRTWAVGITTAPRRRPTLERCLNSLARAGWDRPHLFMDGVVRVPERFGRLPGTLRSPAVGAWPNHYLALFELTLRQPEADAFLIVQDDALLYDGENVREYLEGIAWPGLDAGIVSLYCPAPYTAERPVWRRFRGAWLWGALAFVFSRAAARKYLRDRRVCEHRWRGGGHGLVQIDARIGWWARRRGMPLWFPTPSLVQHVGDTSTLPGDDSADGPRTASQFAGQPPSEPTHALG